MAWTDTTTPLDPATFFGGCYAPDRLAFVGAGQDDALTEAMISSADGINWIYEASPFDAGGFGLAVVRAVALGLYVAGGRSADLSQAIITSPDESSWVGAGNPFLNGGEVFTGLIVRASDDAILAAGTDNQSQVDFSISTDGAASWAAQPVAAATGTDVAIRASDELLMFASNTFSVEISTDGGVTWVTHASTILTACRRCATRDSDDALIIAGGFGGTLAPATSVSHNSGSTWATKKFPFGAVAGFVAGLCVRQSDGAIVVVATIGGQAKIAISTNDGVSWTTHLPLGAVTSQIQGVAIRESDNAIVVSGQDSSNKPFVAVSTDGGSTWTASNPFGGSLTGLATAVTVRQSDDLLLVVAQPIASNTAQASVSSDGGSTWSPTEPFPGGSGYSCAVRVSDGALLVGGNDATAGVQLVLSTDDGATWGATDPAAFNLPSGPGQSIACKQSTGALVVGSSGCPKNIVTTPDATTFTLVSSPFDGEGAVLGIDYSPGGDRWIAAGYLNFLTAVVAYSDDDGATWTEILTHPMIYADGNSPRVYRDETAGNWWLLGVTSGGRAAAVSSDGGATWTEVTTPLGGGGWAYAMVRAGAVLALGGLDPTGAMQMCVSNDAGATWSFDEDPSPFAAGETAYALAYSPDLPLAVVFGAG